MNPPTASVEQPAIVQSRAKRPWQRLHVRIVGLFLGLLLLVQAVSYVALRQTIDMRAAQQVAGDLRTSEAVLQRLLAQTAQRLGEAALLRSSSRDRSPAL